MDRKDAEKAVEVLVDNGYEARVYEDYSGRGMFGATTTGVSTEASVGAVNDLMRELDEAEQEAEASFRSEISALLKLTKRYDQLGKGYIYY